MAEPTVKVSVETSTNSNSLFGPLAWLVNGSEREVSEGGGGCMR